VVVATPLNLGPDEAQYWSWSLTPAFGYFSKPPMIAWIIGASTALCGDGEACIRASSPLFHGATALVLFFAGRSLYDAQVGFWSALAYALMPGTSFSSLLITTDVPLLFFWALALLALAQLMRAPSLAWAIVLGSALGLGFLSKYAMFYFLLGLAFALATNSEGRRLIAGRTGIVVAAVALAVFAPNIVWNFFNEFETVSHTAANANLGGQFKLSKFIEFIGAQIAILGPIAVALLLWGFVRGWRDRALAGPDTLLLAFAAPALFIVTIEAIISRANANWAAPAFVSLAVLVAAWGVRHNAARVLIANLALNSVLALLVMSLAVSPALVAALGQDNAAKRLRGWPEAGRTIVAMLNAAPYTALLCDDREDMASLFYYARPRAVPIRMWTQGEPSNQYEAAYALERDESVRVLFVTRRRDVGDVLKAFTHAERIATLPTRLDSKRTRIFYLYALTGPVSSAPNPQKF
jgi:4-amino-4-deoxy-L-arabinose transferase-like glycosyltransferase